MITVVHKSLDEVKSELADLMRATDGLEFESIEYLSNTDLSTHRFRRFQRSRARYMLSLAESNNKISTIQEHVDPICVRARANKKISTGLLSSHKHYIDIYIFSLTRIDELVQKNDPGPELNRQHIEIVGKFCNNDHETPMRYYWNIVDNYVGNI